MKKKTIAISIGLIAVISIAGCLGFSYVSGNTKGEEITATVEVESTEEFSEVEEEVASITTGGSMGSENLSDITTSDTSSNEYKDPVLENPPIEVEEKTETVESETTVPSDTVVIVEELDLQLYAQQTCNARDKDTTKGNKVTTIERSALLHVTGKTSNGWYRVEHAASPTNIVYIKESLLGANKPQQPQQSQPTETKPSTGENTNTGKPSNDTGNVNQDVQDVINGLAEGGATGGREGGEGAGKW